MQGYDGDKAKILARLRRVEGQVHAVAQMVEDDVYCIDVLTQISAATSALKAVSVMLVDDHLNHCCLLYTSPSPRDRQKSRMPSSA